MELHVVRNWPGIVDGTRNGIVACVAALIHHRHLSMQCTLYSWKTIWRQNAKWNKPSLRSACYFLFNSLSLRIQNFFGCAILSNDGYCCKEVIIIHPCSFREYSSDSDAAIKRSRDLSTTLWWLMPRALEKLISQNRWRMQLLMSHFHLHTQCRKKHNFISWQVNEMGPNDRNN